MLQVNQLVGFGAGATNVSTWATTFLQVLNIDSSGWSGFTMKQVINNPLFGASGSSVRVTVQASSAAGFSLDGLYIGDQAIAGDEPDASSLSRLLFSGSGSLSLSAAQSAVSDVLAFSFDATIDKIISAHFNGTSAIAGRNTLTGTQNFFKGAVDESATANVNVGTYASSGSAMRLVSKIEVLQP